jgi:hypothetical protein
MRGNCRNVSANTKKEHRGWAREEEVSEVGDWGLFVRRVPSLTDRLSAFLGPSSR